MSDKLNLTLKVWRQEDNSQTGDFVTYPVSDVNPHMSFLELLDVLNEKLIGEGGDPIAFEHDCREGICGSCAMNINGEAHGPVKSTTACQLHMFNFKDGDTITVEPWRANSFPILKDLVTDRSAFDRILSAGGYVSVTPVVLQMEMLFLLKKIKQLKRSTQLHVSAAARVYHHVKILQLVFLYPLNSPNSQRYHKASLNKNKE